MGNFKKTTGTVTLDIEKQTGNVDISIDTTSLDSGFAKRDEHLKGEQFFNVSKYPTMKFKSTRLVFAGQKLRAVEGNLTLLGVTKPVKLTIAHFHTGVNPISQKQTVGADALTRIKRSEFGMNTFIPAISDDVSIHIQIEANK